MVQTKSGFIPGQESHTLHTRRRYRLVSGPKSGNITANTPAIDPNLWLFHYIRADRQNQIPVSSIPLSTTNIGQTQHTRRHIASLQQQGLISQKEFYLHDRGSWPSVTFGLTPQMPAKQQANARVAMGQGRGYQSTPQGTPTPASKRQKLPQGTPQPQAMAHPPPPTPQSIAAGHHDPPLTIDEEEDTSRGDMLDHLTAREISLARYTQHHEWMEEVLGSAYPISKIKPVDLGLGLRGDLEDITRGLFDAPTFPPTNPVRKPAAETAETADDGEGSGDKDADEDDDSISPAVLDEFTRRAEKKIKDIEEDMERMKALHQQRLAKIEKTGIIKDAEKKLRAGINFDMFGTIEPEDTSGAPGSGAVSTSGIEEQRISPPPVTMTDEEIVAIVEETLKKKILPREMVTRWDLETGQEVIGTDDIVQEDKDEVMGNTGDSGPTTSTTAPMDQDNTAPSGSSPSRTGSTNNTTQADTMDVVNSGGMEDINMETEDTLMDEPTNFADAFDARDMDDEDEDATPHLVLPPQHHQTASGTTPILTPPPLLPSPSPQPASALTPTSGPGQAPSPNPPKAGSTPEPPTEQSQQNLASTSLSDTANAATGLGIP